MEKLAKYLTAENIEQKDFAEKIGIHPSTLCRLLQGIEPKVTVAVAIERATKGKVKCQDWLQSR